MNNNSTFLNRFLVLILILIFTAPFLSPVAANDFTVKPTSEIQVTEAEFEELQNLLDQLRDLHQKIIDLRNRFEALETRLLQIQQRIENIITKLEELEEQQMLI